MGLSMVLRISFLLFFLCFSTYVFSRSLTQLEGINIDESEFYILDISDYKKKTSTSVDAYRHQQKLYIALTPLFEGLRIKYSLIGNALSVDFDGKSTELLLTKQADNQGQWFHDGSFYFIESQVLEQLFSTTMSLNTNSLTLDLSGHATDFPYKIVNKQKKQRRLNNYILEDQNKNSNSHIGVITVPDKYRLATVPTGFLDLEYQADNSNNKLRGVLQTVSDLAYHSSNITITHEKEQTDSHIEFTRYPQYPGDKILGIWDKYTFGDVWLNKSSLTSGSTRGLGIKLSANNAEHQHQNMTTSFTKTAKPGWEIDIYHNSVFLESRVVPNDGLIEFNDMELHYGANVFKIVLYGPYGEQETIYERVSVRKNSLAQGDTSFGMSFIEQDSSLLDIDLSEFNIDDMAANFNIGLLDNWQLGATIRVQDIHNTNNSNSTQSYVLKNQLTLPGWFFENHLAINEQSFEQVTSIATSFTNRDNFTFQYQSRAQEVTGADDLKTSSWLANYNIVIGSLGNNFYYEYQDLGHDRTSSARHRISANFKYIHLANTIAYRDSENDDDSLTGSLSLTGRVNKHVRFVSSIPYDLQDDKGIQSESIRASLSYNFQDNSGNRHAFTAANSSFFKDNNWSLGYNLLVLAPTHQFTLRTNYNASDNWRVTAGISLNFGYDYFNNSMIFSNKSMRSAGTLDVHTYLDRQLNGIPDILDYDLANVEFSGKKQWQDVKTNEDGRARLFGASNGVTALRTSWDAGASTLNNDYLIYSHPGSVQKINLPFYLTTELEFFIVLNNVGQTSSLRNVPLVVSNKSTGDEYQGESDYDGYVTFEGLLPGKYHVYIEPQFLKEKGLQADISGFEFDSPLKGGFVVLPNIVLARSETGNIGANLLEKVMLDDNNYIPLLESDNDKLIHLPPKGAIKAPYSTDSLHLGKFKRIRMQVTEQQRRELREQLNSAVATAQQTHLGLAKTTNQARKPVVKLAPARDVNADSTKLQVPVTTEPLTIAPSQYKADIITGGKVKKPAQALVNPIINAPKQVAVNTTLSQPNTPEKLDLSSGYVAQFAAFKELSNASRFMQNTTNIGRLHVVSKIIKGITYYCVTSQVFQDKAAVYQHIQLANQAGLPVDATKYRDIILSN